MYRAGLFVFLNLLVFSKCDENEDIYQAVLGDEFDKSNLEGLDIPWSDEVFELFNESGNASFPINSISCGDMNSVMSRGLKWMFANKVNLKKAINLRVYLSSRKQTKRFEAFAKEKFTLDKSDFNIERRTVVIVHGFLNTASQPWIKQLEDAFLLWVRFAIFILVTQFRGKKMKLYASLRFFTSFRAMSTSWSSIGRQLGRPSITTRQR